MSNPPLPLLVLPPELRKRIYGYVFADPKQRSLRHPLRHVSKATHDEVTLMILHERFLTICLRSRYFERQVLIQPSIFLPGDHHIRTSWLEFKKSLLSPFSKPPVSKITTATFVRRWCFGHGIVTGQSWDGTMKSQV